MTCFRPDEWQYAASMGGYGTLNFNQNPDGTFTGTYEARIRLTTDHLKKVGF